MVLQDVFCLLKLFMIFNKIGKIRLYLAYEVKILFKINDLCSSTCLINMEIKIFDYTFSFPPPTHAFSTFSQCPFI